VLLARGRSGLLEAQAECVAARAASVEIAAVDVNDADGVATAIRDAADRYGRLDIVVHAAAVMAYGRIEELPRRVYERVVDTTLHGTANVARPTLEAFRRRGSGSLVVVSSLLASIATPGMGAYVTAKWGQLGLVRVLQLESRDTPGIRISAVAPGGVNTPIYYQAANVIGLEGRPPPPVYSPERVARTIVSMTDSPLRRRRRLVQACFVNPITIAGFRLLPPVFDRLVGPLLRTFGFTDTPIAATDGNVFRPQPGRDAAQGRWPETVSLP
jgi:NAD(P)-dependent dehydrogenase (short-subunit alcohol dehydrogenase family)